VGAYLVWSVHSHVVTINRPIAVARLPLSSLPLSSLYIYHSSVVFVPTRLTPVAETVCCPAFHPFILPSLRSLRQVIWYHAWQRCINPPKCFIANFHSLAVWCRSLWWCSLVMLIRPLLSSLLWPLGGASIIHLSGDVVRLATECSECLPLEVHRARTVQATGTSELWLAFVGVYHHGSANSRVTRRHTSVNTRRSTDTCTASFTPISFCNGLIRAICYHCYSHGHKMYRTNPSLLVNYDVESAELYIQFAIASVLKQFDFI